MKLDLHLQLADKSSRMSRLLIGSGIVKKLLIDSQEVSEGRTLFWIWDEQVWNLWGTDAEKLGWPGIESGRVIRFAASEQNKRLSAVEELSRQLVRLGADRKSCLMSVGGGVTGDVVGFLASIYMRGIPIFQIPTTLLAQVDSSIGGKTGVDLPEGKNLLGTFHQPRVVWIDPKYLRTLPAVQFRQGMAEVIKTALLGDVTLWGYLEEHSDSIKTHKDDALVRVISSCCQVKASVVEADERESGRRRILNLGHTVGHALERLSNYELRHGDAVAIGMVTAARLAVRLGQFAETDAHRLERLCSNWDLPVRVPGRFPPEAIVEALKSDKKRMAQKLHFILPVRIGEVTEIINPDEDILKAILSDLTTA